MNRRGKVYIPTRAASNTPIDTKPWEPSGQFCVNYDKRWTDVSARDGSQYLSAGAPPPLPEKPLFGYIQPWNNRCPKCTAPGGCENLPCATHNLKFGDTYAGIETECNEWIKMACEEAKFSTEHGGGPFGAVIVRVNSETGQPIEYWKSHNHVELWSDPTAHAEVSTIRIACQDLSKRYKTSVFDLSNVVDPNTKVRSHCVIYSSAEP